MTSNQHGPYVLGHTGATMVGTMVAKEQSGANPIKADLSSNWRLQLASMKSESLVTVYQPWYGEYVPGSCTHRPSSHERQGHPKPLH